MHLSRRCNYSLVVVPCSGKHKSCWRGTSLVGEAHLIYFMFFFYTLFLEIHDFIWKLHIIAFIFYQMLLEMIKAYIVVRIGILDYIW